MPKKFTSLVSAVYSGTLFTVVWQISQYTKVLKQMLVYIFSVGGKMFTPICLRQEN